MDAFECLCVSVFVSICMYVCVFVRVGLYIRLAEDFFGQNTMGTMGPRIPVNRPRSSNNEVVPYSVNSPKT